MTTTTPHTCHAHGCTRKTPPARLMCPAHWRLVPYALKSAVYRYYRPGQETDKQASGPYLAAANAAIAAVAKAEARP